MTTTTTTIAGSRCQATQELWGPHPGCKEYMSEPEAIVVCGERATWRVTEEHFWPPECEEDGNGTTTVETQVFCTMHGAERIASQYSDPFAKVVHVDPIPEVLYVNVYAVSRPYGGPEEGGWYYDQGEALASHVVVGRPAANELVDILREQYPDTGGSSSVLQGDDWRVCVQRHPAADYPTTRPHYE